MITLPIQEAIAPEHDIRELLHPRPAADERDAFRRIPVAIIVAAARNGAIGRDGDMIWHLREDLRHFKAVTMGGTVIMGRKTWQSLPKGALPGRRNVVVSRQKDFPTPGAELFPSLEEAIESAAHDPAVFIIGGAEIYRQSLPVATEVYLTRIDADAADADAFFPDLDPEEWALAETLGSVEATDTAPAFTFQRWVRRQP